MNPAIALLLQRRISESFPRTKRQRAPATASLFTEAPDGLFGLFL